MPAARFPLTKLLRAAALVWLTASLAHAQITNVTNDTSTPIPGAGHDYVKMLSETVNPAIGSVSLRISVPMPKGRATGTCSGSRLWSFSTASISVWPTSSAPVFIS